MLWDARQGTLTLNDVAIVALTLWGEARGEELDIQNLVGNVIWNRWALAQESRAYRKAESIRDICLWPVQFSCWNPGDKNRREIQRAIELNLSPYEGYVLKQCRWLAEGWVRGILLPVIMADHYHDQSVMPYWARGKEPERVAGPFSFYRLFR